MRDRKDKLIGRHKFAFAIFVLILSLVFCVGCNGETNNDAEQPPNPTEQNDSNMPLQEDPFGGSFIGSESVSLAEPARIMFTISPIADFPNVSVSIFLPPDIQTLEGELEWQGNVKSGEQSQVVISILVNIRMTGNIKAHVESIADGIAIWRDYYYLVSTTEQDEHASGIKQL